LGNPREHCWVLCCWLVVLDNAAVATVLTCGRSRISRSVRIHESKYMSNCDSAMASVIRPRRWRFCMSLGVTRCLWFAMWCDVVGGCPRLVTRRAVIAFWCCAWTARGDWRACARRAIRRVAGSPGCAVGRERPGGVGGLRRVRRSCGVRDALVGRASSSRLRGISRRGWARIGGGSVRRCRSRPV